VNPLEIDRVISSSEYKALRERLFRVRADIAEAARASGRRPEGITLVGVSKLMPGELALAAVDLGLADLGENRVQEMLEKIGQLSSAGRHPRWHLIGTLQRNKVKYVLGKTELIHSVDSLDLLAEISRLSAKEKLTTSILLQVNTAGEMSKHGLPPEELGRVADMACRSPGICLRGLMMMAPLFPDPEMARPVFLQTKEIFDSLALEVSAAADFTVLSMGMSLDFRQAIACGATHVRIGTAIFGSRSLGV
jgi:pyridoxal phosphate enzyme (YggS family)